MLKQLIKALFQVAENPYEEGVVAAMSKKPPVSKYPPGSKDDAEFMAGYDEELQAAVW